MGVVHSSAVRDTETQTLSISEDLRARIWWSLWCEPGDGEVGELIGHFGAPEAARRIQHAAKRGDGRYPASPREHHKRMQMLIARLPETPSRDRVNEVIEICAREGIRLTTPSDSEWPRGLDDLGPFQPILVFSRGDLAHISGREGLVSVVGTRRPSVSGARAAHAVSQALLDQGLTIVSGGALGIDAIAHRTALSRLRPTVVVGATGLDRHYPREHSGLFDAVARGGVLLSENPPGKPISPRSFLSRNRIIAALASAVVVVECPTRSGALSTASHAATLGRELYAVSYEHTRPENEGAQRLFDEWNATPIVFSGGGTPSEVLAARQELPV